MTDTADTLRAAAFQLRNPFHPPGLREPIDHDLAMPLATLLDAVADDHDLCLHCLFPGRPCRSLVRALVVARQINGTTPDDDTTEET
jgi:hypothetical protein